MRCRHHLFVGSLIIIGFYIFMKEQKSLVFRFFSFRFFDVLHGWQSKPIRANIFILVGRRFGIRNIVLSYRTQNTRKLYFDHLFSFFLALEVCRGILFFDRRHLIINRNIEIIRIQIIRYFIWVHTVCIYLNMIIGGWNDQRRHNINRFFSWTGVIIIDVNLDLITFEWKRILTV